MSTASASLVLPSLNTKTLSTHSQKPNAICILSTLKSHAKPISSFTYSITGSGLLSSSFARNVVSSPDFDVLSDGEDTSFSPDAKLFVGNLPFGVDSAQLAGLFETAGNVQMVEVIYDKVTGRSRGFGFVTMSTAEEAETVAHQFNGYELEGRALRVNSGPPPPKREDSPYWGSRNDAGFSSENGNRLYVGNLPWGTDELALESLFSEMGKVLESKVIYDRESGRSKGFGFVTLGSAEEANNAIDSLNGVELSGRPIRVSLAEAKPKRF